MKTAKIIIKEDLALGELGMILKDINMFNTPMVSHEGLLIAHDLLEHQNGLQAIGSIDDEIEALGGCWFVRGETGVLRQGSHYGPEESLSSDIMNLGTYFCRGINFKTPVPNTYRCEVDDNLQEIVELGIKSLKSELSYSDDKLDYDRINLFKSACLHYLRAGYRKAKRKHKSTYQVNNIFNNIARTVDESVQIDYEGQEYILHYDNRRAYCEENYSEY
jgi:hypothetical protein